MRLIDLKTGQEVHVGDTVTDFRGDTDVIRSMHPPHKPSSEGKVGVGDDNFGPMYYPSVFGLRFVE